jgi:hypothetical protein
MRRPCSVIPLLVGEKRGRAIQCRRPARRSARRSRYLLLASSMSMLESTIWKNGHSRYIAMQARHASRPGCAASHALTALPKPYQPGSIRISRHCAHLKTQGIVRGFLDLGRSFPRRRTAADLEVGDLADHCRLAEKPIEQGIEGPGRRGTAYRQVRLIKADHSITGIHPLRRRAYIYDRLRFTAIRITTIT